MTPNELKATIRLLGLTQQALADRLGIQRNTVVRWLMGVNPIPEWADRFITLLIRQGRFRQ